MNDDRQTDSDRVESNDAAPTISDPYKVLADFEDGNDGVGVLGRNTASFGITRGVEGRVSSPDGYGLATPDDTRIGGAIDTAETDFVVEAGTIATANARNIVMGHTYNVVTAGAFGATISGGGYSDGGSTRRNEVTDN